MTLNVNQHFVDRDPERALFARMLSGEDPARVLRVLVPPGHGKSWLVKRLFLDCEECAVPVVWLNFDARLQNTATDARYVVERFLESLGETRLPRTNTAAAEWRKAAPSQTEAHHLPVLGRALHYDLSHWTDKPATEADEFTRLETGLDVLLARLGKAHPRYQDVTIYRQRLVENIAVARLHGDTATLTNERSRAVAQVNRFTLDVWEIPFDDLCNAPASAALPSPIAILLDTFEQMSDTVRDWLSGWLFDGLRRELAHVRVVVAGRPEPACCAFFERADLWGHLITSIDCFKPMPEDEILEYYQRRDCSFGTLDPDTICHLARTSAGMMAQVGDSLAPGGVA